MPVRPSPRAGAGAGPARGPGGGGGGALAAAINSAAAQLRVAEAARTAARATVEQRRAALVQAQVDLDHTTIRAPVDGVVVSRQVDVGQTGAASLQAPILFTIAQDLTKM